MQNYKSDSIALAVKMTNYDPEIPTNFAKEDWLDFACSGGGTIQFHKDSGYFYYGISDAQGIERLKCACKPFMIKHHDSKCVHNENEYEMSEECWVSDWFLLGSADLWHNHPPPSRVSVELKLFEWQLNFTFVQNRNALTVSHLVEEMYESWPFDLIFSKSQLKILFNNEPEEGSTFLEQDKIDSMMAHLMDWSKYWGNPLDLGNRKLESQPCCGKIKDVKRNKRLPSRGSSTSRLQKKLKLPEVVEDDDYDTEPLPEKAIDPKCKIELEPIACGSRDRTPSPKIPPSDPRSTSKHTASANINDNPEDLIDPPKKGVLKDVLLKSEFPKAIPLKNGRPWGPFSLRHPVEELKLKIEKAEEICEPIKKVIRFAENLVKQSKKIGNRNGIDIFAVPLSKSIGSRSTVQRFVFGQALHPKKHMTVLVLGSTELGQTKLINGIINHIFNVVKEDNFRFQLVEKKEDDQLNCISVYDIHHTEGFCTSYSITIIHTPSYNTESTTLFRNGKLVQTFREFFEDVDEINDIDMICNVVLKDGVHNSFLSIFGYDVEENINCFWLRNTEEFPFDELIQRFFSVLTSTKTKSLKGTLEVLQVMKRLEETVNSFIPLMKSLSAKEEEIEKARLMLTTCQSQIESNTKIDTNFSLETVEQTYRTKVLWEKIECEGRELFDLLEKDFDGIARTMLHYFEIVWFSIRQLKRISRGNPYLTQELYDLLFDVEEKLKRQGYQENIEKLKN